ncbi:hypothetical protein I6M42_08875 [Shewanella algae]|uniref:leucine-rich repeat domain-containing protein n=1 Tax=Shewanella algae TaxID=38313 RepID=UPI001AAFA63F|nr:hypothetical protein [Shewanella algae]MBO2636774.1 hypothetical protein [Shewanella algae]
MIKQKYVGSLTVILGLWLLVVGQVLALSPEEKATAIIQASPAAQNIQRGFKSEYGSLYFFVEGLTGKIGPLPSEQHERRNDAFIPAIIGSNEFFGGTGSLSRIAVLLDQQGKAINVVVEGNTKLTTEFIKAVANTRYMLMWGVQFLDGTLDLSQFGNLERLAIIAVDTTKHIVLPEAGNLAKLRIDQANLESVLNVEKQTRLNVLISSVVNFDGFDIVDGSQSLKYLSIDLSGSELDIGSLMNLESARLTMPEYKNISTINKLEHLRELSIRRMNDPKVKDVILPNNLEEIWMFNIKKGSLPKISHLPKLKSVSFRSVEDNILENMDNLPNLKELFGAGVELPTLDGIEKLPSLVTVNLNNNETIDISSVASLSKLEGLFVSENVLDDVNVIAEMPWLKDIDVSYNRLRALPKLKLESKLKSIDFSDNPIEAISPEVLASYSSVRKSAYNTPFYQSLTHEQRRAF